jgi:hypothetical protein
VVKIVHEGGNSGLLKQAAQPCTKGCMPMHAGPLRLCGSIQRLHGSVPPGGCPRRAPLYGYEALQLSSRGVERVVDVL